MAHTHELSEAKIFIKTSQKIEQKKKTNYNSFFISKWTKKHVISFSLTTRATAHNNNNALIFAILEYKSPF